MSKYNTDRKDTRGVELIGSESEAQVDEGNGDE